MTYNSIADDQIRQPAGIKPAKHRLLKTPNLEVPWARLNGEGSSSGDDVDCSQGWDGWFVLDPAPRFVVNREGQLRCANPASKRALDNGQLAVTSLGTLKFGSADCDTRYLSAVQQVVDSGLTMRAVLRQRHGGWFTADVHGVPGETWCILALSAELNPTQQSMDAICRAFQLSRSETDVLTRLLDGQCPKIAAKLLRISEHTVRAHLRSIYAKMGVRGLNNTIRLASSLL
ncbi:hypothetical protein BZG35_01600 [Brevundimonas sp. LM2]|uniref:helix-turn-helix transcriptional regulator n=1 Tax=Brevundimonas sp. LM2 TaxID=1938605 RepID=UPI000983CA4D|nr:helix-turn-helix transcriptional regulator [Brevundimonas sp. LM2]AQR60493.1 hypothetical protein BZG35_01600 [Brevundimonas sp. LM2]